MHTEYSDGQTKRFTGSQTFGLTSRLSAGVPRSHLISYEEDGALLVELFTKEGRGTLLSNE